MLLGKSKRNLHLSLQMSSSSSSFAIGGPSSTNFIFFPDGTSTLLFDNDAGIPNRLGFSIGVSASLFGVTGVTITGVVTFTIAIRFLDGSERTQVIQLTPVQLFQSRIIATANVQRICISAVTTAPADIAATVSATVNAFVLELQSDPVQNCQS